MPRIQNTDPSTPSTLPVLRTSGNAVQLLVHGNPFLILGGELGNSTATTAENMQPLWPELAALNLNTVLVPVFWEMIEAKEGTFDFSLLDGQIEQARAHDLKLALLWFGSWKNSMSSHAPAWVKTDAQRFPRAKDKAGKSYEILTPFSPANLQADLKAFTMLMKHLRAVDGRENTVIMVQVENEVGMLPSARDHHPLADKAFSGPVPRNLLQALHKNKEFIGPALRKRWKAQGFKGEGSWEKVFGKGDATEEYFMAYHFASFANQVAEAGKKAYPLPMFVNAALNQPDQKPGSGYPSGGPLPHLLDFWKAAGQSINFYAPDIYTKDFKHWARLYHQAGHPLFIPEHQFDDSAAAKAIYAIGHHQALGFCPFAIESGGQAPKDALRQTYHLLKQLSPQICAAQASGKIEAVLLDKAETTAVFSLGNIEVTATHTHCFGWSPGAQDSVWPEVSALIIQTAPKEFLFAGSGVALSFKAKGKSQPQIGILKAEEGGFTGGKWKILRHLNGDQTHQGRHVRFLIGEVGIQKFSLYEYD